MLSELIDKFNKQWLLAIGTNQQAIDSSKYNKHIQIEYRKVTVRSDTLNT